MPSYVYFKDANNTILNLNRAAAGVMQLGVDDVAGRATENFFPAEDADAFLTDDLEVLSSGAPKLGIEEYHEGSQGDCRLIRTDKYPLRTTSGEPRLVAIATDITELLELSRIGRAHVDPPEVTLAPLCKTSSTTTAS